MRAVSAAKNRAILLDSVPNHVAAAMRARWRESVDRAFERIERVTLARYFNDKRLIVVIATNFAFHGMVLLEASDANVMPPEDSSLPKVHRRICYQPWTLDSGLFSPCLTTRPAV